ncbi:MAG: flagellar type III secretion system pore protein FliP [bacterium]|jgi:flagellar biosynthetic protein FliP
MTKIRRAALALGRVAAAVLRRHRAPLSVLAGLWLASRATPLFAQGLPRVGIDIGTAESPADVVGLLQILLLFTLITLAPSLLVMVTPFTRIIVVLSLLRSALGTQHAPPNQVLIGIALFLTLFIMAPVNYQINQRAVQPYLKGTIEFGEAVKEAEAPLRKFMLAQTRRRDIALFVQMAKLENVESIEQVPTYVIIPAFMTSELKTAFQIGFIIFIPFLIIDLVVSSILMSMGMLMLPPVLISLPFKLLLFVMADGWNLIFASLARSFNVT